MADTHRYVRNIALWLAGKTMVSEQLPQGLRAGTGR